jgi:holo-[acyl-carrier protein] synthase
MIFGVGLDMLEIDRMKKLLTGTSADRLMARILTKAEQEIALTRKGRLAEFVAGRFAAKEAVVKAFGCGLGGIIGFQDIEILPDAWGKPRCSISHDALVRLGLTPSESLRFHISITHSQTMAAAYVIIEQL